MNPTLATMTIGEIRRWRMAQELKALNAYLANEITHQQAQDLVAEAKAAYVAWCKAQMQGLLWKGE